MNSQYQVKSMLKQKVTLLQKHDNHLFGKSLGAIFLTPSNPRNRPKVYIYIEQKSPSHLAPHTHREKIRGKSLFLTKNVSKNFKMETNNNNSNVIPTTVRQGDSNSDMLDITFPEQTFFNMDLNPGKSIQWGSRKVHQLIKTLFSSKSFPDTPLAGRFNYFVGAWMRIIQDPKTLDTVKEYRFSFHSKPVQSKILSQSIVSRKGAELVKLEVEEMLKKRSIREVVPSKVELASNLFLLKKKDGSLKPVINLKQLNAHIPYCHFKMECLQNLKYMLQKGYYMRKLNLEISLGKKFKAICLLPLVRKIVRVHLPLLWFVSGKTNINKIV